MTGGTGTRALGLLGACGLAYLSVALLWPGLSGGFLLDDAGNLRRLQQFGPVRDWESLLVALGNGSAGPTGRPVAVLSLILQQALGAQGPWAFKLVNVLIHALNALLLYALLLRLTTALDDDRRRATGIALVAAGLWAVHPLWVSSALYVVQRMALLSTTFSLLACLAFVVGRLRIAAGDVKGGLARMTGGLVVFGGLGLFSKENAALLPLLLLALEVCLFRSPQFRARFPAPRPYRVFVGVALLLPGLLLLVWLLSRWSAGDYKALDYWGISMLERAAIGTQMVFEYLRLLWLPTDVTNGLYYDDLRPAEWLTAPRVLTSHLGLAGLVGLAFWLRGRFAVASVAIVFFLAGHLLETWLVALEPGFEHRNYLPAVLMFWPLAWLLFNSPLREFMRGRAHLLLAAALLFWLAATTVARSTLWGVPYLQAAAWAQANPRSERAQAYLVEQLVDRGEYTAALAQLEHSMRLLPDSGVLALAGLHLGCPVGQAPHWLPRVRRNVAVARPRMDYYQPLLVRITRAVSAQACPGLDLDELLDLALLLQQQPAVQARAVRRERALHIVAGIRLARGQVPEAVDAYRQALVERPFLDGALTAATQLAGAGDPAAGLSVLEHWEALGGKPGRPRSEPLARLAAPLRDRLMLAEYERIRQRLAAQAAAS